MELWYENGRGETLDLLNKREYVLIAQTGLTSLPSNELSTTDTVLTEGNTVLWRRRAARTMVLTHEFLHDVKKARLNFLHVLDQREKGRIYYRDDEKFIYIDVDVEDCEIDNMSEKTKATTTFVASYPYFKDVEETLVYNSGIINKWFFPFTFPVTFGETTANNEMIVENDCGFPVGFIATVRFNGEVSGFSLQNQKGEYMEFDSYSEGAGLVINTIQGEKNVTDLDGVNLLVDMRLGSKMFQLEPGINILRMVASSGVENAELSLTYRNIHKAV